MEHLIPIELLRTLLVLRKNRSFSKTAELLGRSQSTISLQMQRLQEIAGGPVFTSSGKTLSLTEQGRIIHEYAVQIMQLNDECMARLSGRLLMGTIRVGIPSDFAITYLPSILGRFGEENPLISLDVQCELSASMIRKFQDQKLDLLLCLHNGEPSPHLIKTWWDPVVWVGNKSKDLSRKRPVALILFPEGCEYRNRVIRGLKHRNVSFKIVYSSASMAGNQAAIESGLGLTALSRTSVPPQLKALAEAQSLPDLGRVEIGLYMNTRGATKATLELGEYLVAVLDKRLGPRASPGESD